MQPERPKQFAIASAALMLATSVCGQSTLPLPTAPPADLDAYVDYPRSAASEFDVVLVDGRKRRRCLLTALDLAGEHTAVLLHDSSRTYYHPAMREYPASRFIGDELWIGAASETTLAMALAGQQGRA